MDSRRKGGKRKHRQIMEQDRWQDKGQKVGVFADVMQVLVAENLT